MRTIEVALCAIAYALEQADISHIDVIGDSRVENLKKLAVAYLELENLIGPVEHYGKPSVYDICKYVIMKGDEEAC